MYGVPRFSKGTCPFIVECSGCFPNTDGDGDSSSCRGSSPSSDSSFHRERRDLGYYGRTCKVEDRRTVKCGARVHGNRGMLGDISLNPSKRKVVKY